MTGCHDSEPKKCEEKPWVCAHGKLVKLYDCEMCEFKVDIATQMVLINQLQEFLLNKIDSRLDELTNRIFGLEAKQEHDSHSFNEILDKLEHTVNSIDKDMSFVPSFDAINPITDRLDKLEIKNTEDYEKYKKLERHVDQTRILFMDQIMSKRKPHKCPVCDGKSKQVHLLTGLLSSACDACEGKGIVWG